MYTMLNHILYNILCTYISITHSCVKSPGDALCWAGPSLRTGSPRADFRQTRGAGEAGRAGLQHTGSPGNLAQKKHEIDIYI